MRILEVNSVLVDAPSKSGIYKIEHIDSGKLYVGSAINLRKRWNRHLFLLRKNRHDNIHLQRAWDLYGAESFKFSVLEHVFEPNELIAREQFWIDKLEVMRTGYNLSPFAGSRKGKKHTDETKRKIAKACQGRLVSEETRQRMSIAFTGRTMSPEARAKLSVIGRNRSPETRAKQRATFAATLAMKRLLKSSTQLGESQQPSKEIK